MGYWRGGVSTIIRKASVYRAINISELCKNGDRENSTFLRGEKVKREVNHVICALDPADYIIRNEF